MDKSKLQERQKFIRNFSIIAHIDHGKSTLADRILETTNTVEQREMKQQLLDEMDLERERGITIKLNAVELDYKANDGNTYTFHLIDTPGHVDFTYEVSRSLAACEGALLVIDATQGIEAQTLANVYLAFDNDLEIIPVINKIDLPSADVDRVKHEVEKVIGIDASDAVLASAKEGIGIPEILERVVQMVPAPDGDIDEPLQALIFDSFYDQYRGIVPLVRVKNGIIKVGDKIKFMATGAAYEVVEVGVRKPKEQKRDFLAAGDVGYITAAIKDIQDVHVGDTITNAFKPAKEALDKLKLNDASLIYEPETSKALGFGFRVGFLGLLHMDVIEERIEREFGIDLIATAPSVSYKVYLTDETVKIVDNPSAMPEPNYIKYIEEPYVKATIMLPNEYVGTVMELCQYKRGNFITMEYLDEKRVTLYYEIPLSEVVFDFFDRLKSSTKGYASFDYELMDYKRSNLVRMDILLNGEKVDALSVIIHKDNAHTRGKGITEKLKELLPRQMFEVPIQAAINGKIVARSDLKALRKDVLAKCYGGDITRKKKLLEKQKEGKKRMKAVGSVEIPQSAFLAVLSIDK